MNVRIRILYLIKQWNQSPVIVFTLKWIYDMKTGMFWWLLIQDEINKNNDPQAISIYTTLNFPHQPNFLAINTIVFQSYNIKSRSAGGECNFLVKWSIGYLYATLMLIIKMPFKCVQHNTYAVLFFLDAARCGTLLLSLRKLVMRNCPKFRWNVEPVWIKIPFTWFLRCESFEIPMRFIG